MCSKVRYPTPRAAQAALRAFAATCARRGTKVPVAVYPCGHCGSWHITSKRPTGRPRWWENRVTPPAAP